MLVSGFIPVSRQVRMILLLLHARTRIGRANATSSPHNPLDLESFVEGERHFFIYNLR